MNAITTAHPIRETWLRLSRSQFFIASLLFHFLVVLFFGGKALFETLKTEPDMIAYDGEIVSSETNLPAAPPPATPREVKPAFDATPTRISAAPADWQAILSQAPTSNPLPQILTIAPTRSSFVPAPGTTYLPEPIQPVTGQMSSETRTSIKNFIEGWSPSQPGGSLRDKVFHFTAYVARYSGGDWASTVQKNGDQITGGSLPNLLYLINAQSRDKITATADPVAIDLASDLLFTVKPPFIFFTGHRDFTLTDLEVTNLRRYLRLGGCIWGDSSLPGSRSRFDLAFRREMRRVIPDADKTFMPLPADHPIFTRPYYREITALPPGLNHYREPLYALTYQGQIAVLYTANDYADLWQIGLDTHWQIDLRKDAQNRYVAINPALWEHREIYFRGLEPAAIADSFKLGTNIVLHLLTRWDDQVRNVGAY